MLAVEKAHELVSITDTEKFKTKLAKMMAMDKLPAGSTPKAWELYEQAAAKPGSKAPSIPKDDFFDVFINRLERNELRMMWKTALLKNLK